ncbi:unnamed protein product [Hermetia illucens]|nr:unnamed protein product [Hermetia illucens]
MLTADVAKMYRQIRVRSNDADLQRIVWRPNEAFQQGRSRDVEIVQWHPQRDMFMFNIHAKTLSTSGPTKRTVASKIASLFDPLGWLQPFMIKGKVFKQKLCLQKLEWDDKLPPELAQEWQTYLDGLGLPPRIDSNYMDFVTHRERLSLL